LARKKGGRAAGQTKKTKEGTVSHIDLGREDGKRRMSRSKNKGYNHNNRGIELEQHREKELVKNDSVEGGVVCPGQGQEFLFFATPSENTLKP